MDRSCWARQTAPPCGECRHLENIRRPWRLLRATEAPASKPGQSRCLTEHHYSSRACRLGRSRHSLPLRRLRRASASRSSKNRQPTMSPRDTSCMCAARPSWASGSIPRTLEVIGTPVRLLDNVRQAQGAGAAQFSVSAAAGTLVYVAGAGGNPVSRLTLVDRQGQTQTIAPPARPYGNPRVSPDGQRIVVDIEDSAGSNLWVYRRNFVPRGVS